MKLPRKQDRAAAVLATLLRKRLVDLEQAKEWVYENVVPKVDGYPDWLAALVEAEDPVTLAQALLQVEGAARHRFDSTGPYILRAWLERLRIRGLTAQLAHELVTDPYVLTQPKLLARLKSSLPVLSALAEQTYPRPEKPMPAPEELATARAALDEALGDWEKQTKE